MAVEIRREIRPGTLRESPPVEVECVLCSTVYPEVLLVDGLCMHCINQMPPPDPEPDPSDDELTAALEGIEYACGS